MEAREGAKGRRDVEGYIVSKSLNWKLIEVPGSARTVDDAARLLGVDRSSIVKTLIVICEKGTYAAIVPGDRKLDMAKLRNIAGECRLAKPREVLEKTGYPAGGVPPIALTPHIKIIVDRGVLEKHIVYGGGGEERVLLEFSPQELLKVVEATVADVSVRLSNSRL
ncbi:MAG: YbaK/EbsC family protein [Thermoprotei archaeon]|nr:YbaK/EbsC family protein [Thermoprotei archaeon]